MPQSSGHGHRNSGSPFARGMWVMCCHQECFHIGRLVLFPDKSHQCRSSMSVINVGHTRAQYQPIAVQEKWLRSVCARSVFMSVTPENNITALQCKRSDWRARAHGVSSRLSLRAAYTQVWRSSVICCRARKRQLSSPMLRSLPSF